MLLETKRSRFSHENFEIFPNFKATVLEQNSAGCHSEWNAGRVDERDDTDTDSSIFLRCDISDVAVIAQHQCVLAACEWRQPK